MDFQFEFYRDTDNCPACGKRFAINPKKKARGYGASEHHIIPKRFMHENNTDTITICRTCHDYLEKRIPMRKKQTQERYLQILNTFLKDRAIQSGRPNQVYVVYAEDTGCYTLLSTDISVDTRKVDTDSIQIIESTSNTHKRSKKKYKKYSGICRACEKEYTNKMVRRKTVHHVFPSALISNLKHIEYQETIDLCALCHKELEDEIREKKPGTKEEMLKCLNSFLSRFGSPIYSSPY